MEDLLAELKRERNLISIRREGIDGNGIQAFLIDFSDELMLIKYVYDFTLDGLMVLRRSDITDIGSDKTNLLQTQILKDEGIYSKVDFEIRSNLESWGGVFSTLGKQHRFITIEDENPEYPLFYLGEICNIGTESVSIMGFSGAANWDDETSEIYFEDISSVQIGNNYAMVYERYFEKNTLITPEI